MTILPDQYQKNLRIDGNEAETKCCVILVVDDDDAMRSLLVDELTEYGCCVVQAADGEEAFSQLEVKIPNVVVTDLQMKAGGFEFIKRLKATLPECRVIVVTAFGDARTLATAKGVGVDGYLDKPVRMVDLKALVAEICPASSCKHIRGQQPI